MEVREVMAVLAVLASAQWGLFTSAQAATRGVTRLHLSRLAEAGLLERVAHGVYREAGVAGEEFEGVRSAWLAIIPKADASARLKNPAGDVVVSGACAAWLHGIGDLRAEGIEFSSAVRRQTQRKGVRIVTRHVDGSDVAMRHGLPVTTVERTIADLLIERIDLSLVSTVLGDALRSGSVSLESLVARLGPHAASYGLPVGDGQALLDRLLRLAGLDADALARRISGIDALAIPIAANVFQDLADQSRRAQEMAARLQVTMPDVTHFAAQAEALARAFRPQVEAMRALTDEPASIAADWQKAIERLTPSLEALAAVSRFASVGASAGSDRADAPKAAP